MRKVPGVDRDDPATRPDVRSGEAKAEVLRIAEVFLGREALSVECKNLRGLQVVAAPRLLRLSLFDANHDGHFRRELPNVYASTCLRNTVSRSFYNDGIFVTVRTATGGASSQSVASLRHEKREASEGCLGEDRGRG